MQRASDDVPSTVAAPATAGRPTLAISHFEQGLKAQADGQYWQAYEHFYLALLAEPDNVAALTNLGATCRACGSSEEAEHLYREALRREGAHHAVCHHNLGNLLLRRGLASEAAEHYGHALKLDPSMDAARLNLVAALCHQDRFSEALAQFELLRPAPTVPQHLLHARLAATLNGAGKKAEALRHARAAVLKEPRVTRNWILLATVAAPESLASNILFAIREVVGAGPQAAEEIAPHVLSALAGLHKWDVFRVATDEFARRDINVAQHYVYFAEQLYLRSHFAQLLRLCECAALAGLEDARLLELAAIVDVRFGRHDRAAASFHRALRMTPQDSGLWCNYSHFLFLDGDYERAIKAAQHALQLSPGALRPYHQLTYLLAKVGRLADGEQCSRDALSLARTGGEEAAVRRDLARCFLLQGRLAESIEQLDRAVELDQDNIDSVESSNQAMFTRLYCDVATPAELAAMHRKHGALLSERYAAERITAWSNPPDMARPLRIGLVSADFNSHPVGQLLASWLGHVDRDAFHVICYSATAKADQYTAAIRGAAAEWRETAPLGTTALRDQVQADRIDILMDLSGYTEGNRIDLFAMKPAPVQAAWAGYVFTTGLPEMDAVLQDDYTTVPEIERLYTERVLRLPGCVYAYSPLDAAPDVAPTPALARGHVTFGCFNHVPKLTDTTLRLWAGVLRGVPDARLVLKAGPFDDQSTRDRYYERLAALGIAPERVEFRGGSPFQDFLAQFSDIDIALDPFPFNGGITTLLGLWQGVPLVTLAGETHVSRVGGSILNALGLPGWVAATPEEYQRIAIANARDLPALDALRQSMRTRLERSPVGDGRSFAKRMEQAWRDLWTDWCRRQGAH